MPGNGFHGNHRDLGRVQRSLDYTLAASSFSMTIHSFLVLLAAAGVFPAAAPAQGTAAAPTATAKPLAGVEVIVTRGPDRAFKSTKTAADGGYTIDWPEGTGDYLVHV